MYLINYLSFQQNSPMSYLLNNSIFFETASLKLNSSECEHKEENNYIIFSSMSDIKVIPAKLVKIAIIPPSLVTANIILMDNNKVFQIK